MTGIYKMLYIEVHTTSTPAYLHTHTDTDTRSQTHRRWHKDKHIHRRYIKKNRSILVWWKTFLCKTSKKKSRPFSFRSSKTTLRPSYITYLLTLFHSPPLALVVLTATGTRLLTTQGHFSGKRGKHVCHLGPTVVRDVDVTTSPTAENLGGLIGEIVPVVI